MAVLEDKTLAERNKLIAAAVLGVIALFVLWSVFFGSSSTPQKSRRTARSNTPPSPDRTSSEVSRKSSLVEADNSLTVPQPIEYDSTLPPVPEARRNIFAYYTPPTTQATANATQPTPLPSVTPPPPPSLILAAVSPSSAYAQTGEFALEVSGDKFTPEARIFVDGQELPTRFTSVQKLTATVPAAFTASPGARQVVVRTSDGQLFSNSMTLNVTAPPAPSHTYVGLLGSTRYSDTAVLKDQSGELLNVQRGDIIGGRFRVTSISERAIDLIDTQLRIKHTLRFVEARPSPSAATMNRNSAPRNSPPPPRPPVLPDDDGKP